ncbi:MAG: ribosomal RNA small subunit methyltransferase A [Calditrichaeota bacterium]|nr:ribosomal RNA small subunit methyltransferase A [Calditrichota bacterium]
MKSNPRIHKSLGQCFLRDRAIADYIAATLPLGEPVIEIGCGDGFFTEALLDAGHQVLGVEIDTNWIPKLQRRIRHRREFQLIAPDILTLDWSALFAKFDRIQVTGNLPYHLTSPIIFSVFKQVREAGGISRLVVMLQREVAERFAAESGGRGYGSITVLAQYHSQIKYLLTAPKDSFYPQPRVEGGVVVFDFKLHPQLPGVGYEYFRRLVRGCFAQRRKMLRNAIRVVNDLPTDWEAIDFDFSRRPEQVSFEEYLRLAQSLIALKPAAS